jgi:hypothetical protein
MRPTFVGLLTFVLIIGLMGTRQPLASDSGMVQFQWESRDRVRLDVQRSFLNEKGGQVGHVQEKDAGVKNPAAIALFVAVGVAAFSTLADSIVRALKDYEHGGLVLDMQGPTTKIVESQSLERGQVLVRKPNGEVVSYTYKSGSSPDLSAIITSLLAGAKTP